MRKQRFLFLIVVGVLLWTYGSGASVPVDNHVEISEEAKYIALTFDDGPKQGTTDLLLDGLKVRGASATFFLIGKQAQIYPELVKRIQAEGHQVGNHTWDHVRLEGAAEEVVREEVGRTESLLAELLGGSDYWLRPPYGQITPGTEKNIQVPMVKWSVDPRDWESRDTDQIVQAILKDVRPNSIILLHDIYLPSVEAALRVVDTLQAEGYWFVTVDELMRLNGITAEAGVLYRSGSG